MNHKALTGFLVPALLWLAPGPGHPQTGAAGLKPVIGFEDTNGDGVNRLFHDANGDGVNDVDGKPYPHEFKFTDANGDGINDLWVDADGDGVNDLAARFETGKRNWMDEDGDGIADENPRPLRGRYLKKYVLDADHDGKNDVTGEPVSQMIVRFQGDRLEGIRQRRMDRFIDRDGDGIDDNRERRALKRILNAKRKAAQ
jgi:hypothetical protein